MRILRQNMISGVLRFLIWSAILLTSILSVLEVFYLLNDLSIVFHWDYIKPNIDFVLRRVGLVVCVVFLNVIIWKLKPTFTKMRNEPTR